jgi:hypothetical protein
MLPPVYPAPPIYPPAYPAPYYGPGYGRGYYGPIFTPRPGGPVHYGRVSLHDGCEIQQGNNGEFAVLTPNGEALYIDRAEHADANAEYMKKYYENSKTGLCNLASSQPKPLDI